MDENGKIGFLIMDVDGTLTDGKIYISADGEVMKAFNVKDGYGIHTILREKDIVPVIITGRESNIVEERCKELKINHVYQGVINKSKKLDEVLKYSSGNFGGSIQYSNIAYIGDDINDIECMNKIKNGGGLVGCPKDAVEEVKAICQFISRYNGGDGAVREFIEYIVN